MIKFSKSFYKEEVNWPREFDDTVDMRLDNDADCTTLVEFFARFALALGYSPLTVYSCFEEYLHEHSFEVEGNKNK
tara:strand:+ start:212 stop:439 length:228 start_codon:yes stop_codon:yes gene_type:complete